jgi:hypothetical protein
MEINRKVTGPVSGSSCKEQENQILYVLYLNNFLKIEFQI